MVEQLSHIFLSFNRNSFDLLAVYFRMIAQYDSYVHEYRAKTDTIFYARGFRQLTGNEKALFKSVL